MRDKEQLLQKIGENYGYFKEYVDRKLDYYRLEAAEKASAVISGLITVIVLLLLAGILVTLLVLSLGFYLADALGGDTGTAFLIMAGVMLLLIIVVFVLRRLIITRPVVSMVISKFFSAEKYH